VAKLPGVPNGTTLQYPTVTQLTNAATYVDANWAAMVGAG